MGAKGKMFRLLMLLCVFADSAISGAGEIHRWVDDNGTVYFTDNSHDLSDMVRGDTGRRQAPKNNLLPPPKAPTNRTSIPFELQGSVVVVNATLNRRTTAKLVVDTGASFTMISSATAKQLNIDTSQNQRSTAFQTANGTIQAPLFNLDSITVGDLEVKDLTAAIHDIGDNPAVSDSNAVANMKGLLGLDFLSKFRIDIDIQKGVLYLEKK
jgi:clan AA aspartic protease (TIGR02281 family)